MRPRGLSIPRWPSSRPANLLFSLCRLATVAASRSLVRSANLLWSVSLILNEINLVAQSLIGTRCRRLAVAGEREQAAVL